MHFSISRSPIDYGIWRARGHSASRGYLHCIILPVLPLLFTRLCRWARIIAGAITLASVRLRAAVISAEQLYFISRRCGAMSIFYRESGSMMMRERFDDEALRED